MNALLLAPAAICASPLPISSGGRLASAPPAHMFDALIGVQPGVVAAAAPDVSLATVTEPAPDTAEALVDTLDRSAALLPPLPAPVDVALPTGERAPEPRGSATVSDRAAMSCRELRLAKPGVRTAANKTAQPDAQQPNGLTAPLITVAIQEGTAPLPTFAPLPNADLTPMGQACADAADPVVSGTVRAAPAPSVGPLAAAMSENAAMVAGNRQQQANDLPQDPAIVARMPEAGSILPVRTDNVPQPAANPAPLAVERQLDLARGDVWLDDLARDIAATAVRGGHLKFALAPETLGRLDVEVRHGDAGVSVHLAARNEAVREALATAQPRLVDEIRAQGIRVASAEIAAETSAFRGDRDGQTARQPHAPLIEASAPHSALASEPRKPVATGRYA